MDENLTATQAMQKLQVDHDRMHFERMAHDFIQRWSPDDRDEAARFQAELFGIVRALFIDVQKPVQDTVTAIMSTQLNSRWYGATHPIAEKEDQK